MTRCDLTDLLTDQCAHCLKLPDPFAEVLAFGPWFTAVHPGACSGCGRGFYMFEVIRADGEGGYQAERCCGST